MPLVFISLVYIFSRSSYLSLSLFLLHYFLRMFNIKNKEANANCPDAQKPTPNRLTTLLPSFPLQMDIILVRVGKLTPNTMQKSTNMLKSNILTPGLCNQNRPKTKIDCQSLKRQKCKNVFRVAFSN